MRTSFLLVSSLIICSCIQPLPTDSSVSGNQNPVIEKILIDPVYIRVGSSTKITVMANDPEGDALSYSWNAPLGDIIGSGAEVYYTATYCCVGQNRVNVIVKDVKGGSTSASVDIVVNP
jgi:hypothetical protein